MGRSAERCLSECEGQSVFLVVLWCWVLGPHLGFGGRQKALVSWHIIMALATVTESSEVQVGDEYSKALVRWHNLTNTARQTDSIQSFKMFNRQGKGH